MGTEAEFRAHFEAHYGDLLGYAIRRCGSREDAEDVVSETFQIAWRRFDDLPSEGEVRLWLFGTARRVLANHHRGRRRARSLVERLRRYRVDDGSEQGLGRPVGQQDLVAVALARLSDVDREILLLHAWEELSSPEIAEVLDISASAARKRLERARARSADLLDDLTQPEAATSGHLGDIPTI